MQQRNLTILGPLSMEIFVQSEHSLKLCGDSWFANFSAIQYGGPLVRIKKFVNQLSYDANLLTYTGTDNIGDKITESVKKDMPDTIIQRLINENSPIIYHLNNKKTFSAMITFPLYLDLWKLQVNNFKFKRGSFVYLDPTIPSSYQREIILNNPKLNFIVRKPIDNELDIFYQTKNLFVILNEFEAYQIASKMNIDYFSCHEVLKSSALQNHHAVIETKGDINILDKDNAVFKKISLKKQKKFEVTNEAFIAGTIAGILSNQNPDIAFTWGLANSFEVFRQTNINRNLIAEAAKEYEWVISKE